MSLNDALKTATIEELKEVNIRMLDSYARENHTVLKFLYNNGILDDSSIEGALEEAVFKQAREGYEIMVKRKGSPGFLADYVGPEYLAYALEKGKFSKREIKQIPFDHGETARVFPQYYGRENLLFELRGRVLNPKPLLKLESHFDSRPTSCSN